MKLDDVPQDAETSSYAGHSKLLYAVDQQGGNIKVRKVLAGMQKTMPHSRH